MDRIWSPATPAFFKASRVAAATRDALKKAGVAGDQILSIALDTTGSSVIPVGTNLQPLDDYYLWCDHRAKAEAAEITEAARREKLEADRKRPRLNYIH